MFDVKFLIKSFNLNKLLILSGIVALGFISAFFFWWQRGEILINNDDLSGQTSVGLFPASSISGVECENSERRPIAVMLSSDLVTRPLSGISQADIVFEMPVTPGGVTRMMAVYQCESPKEVGSIRSAREDFIPLVAGLGATYAHWGGEREALARLSGHIVDNIDAMKYEGTYFYRRSGMKQPHNGFSSFDKLWQATSDLGYGINNIFSGYVHKNKDKSKNISNLAEVVEINYIVPFNVMWSYDKATDLYKRTRGGQPEMDHNNNEQVQAKVIIVMETESSFISKDYMNVRVTGEGRFVVYQHGIKAIGKWKKDPERLDSKLVFYDGNGREFEFMPGKIWVEITIN